MEDKSEEVILDNAVSQVVNTLKFYGVEIINMEVSEKGPPSFKVQIISSKSKREIKDTLNIVYWSLWSLVYGKYTDENKNNKIVLNYKIVKKGRNES